MKTQTSSLELHFMVRELQQLVDGKVDKIYHPSKEELLITVHIPNMGKKILRINSGKSIYLTESRETASEPSNFCVFLRKHLSNARIRSIRQLQPERIVEIELEKREGKKKLVAELFGRGNILLTDGDGTILAAIDYRKFKDRTIRPKEKYIPPKSRVNAFSMKLDELNDSIRLTEKDSLATFLAVDLGIGGTFAEELCLISGIDKRKSPKELAPEECSNLLDNLLLVLKSKPEPNITTKEGKLLDISPLRLGIHKGNEVKHFDNFSDAIDEGVSKFLTERRITPKEAEINRIRRVTESQELKVREMGESEKENREKAELIYSNYRLVDSVLKDLRKIGKEHSWQEIKEKLKDHKIIKSVDPKEKKIVIEVK